MKIAIIGTYPPRQCGIATFTHDLFKSLKGQSSLDPAIVSITDGSETFFPDEVSFTIEKNNLLSYYLAANHINSNYDVVIIQHEYGIFGGDSGNYIIHLAQQLSIPLVTNFHTVLLHPSPEENRILYQLASHSNKVTVMTETAVRMLSDNYHIIDDKIDLIPHGVPYFKYNQNEAKKNLGLTGKKVMLSFGFLGPSKGFETAIEAVAMVPHDDFIYIILGTTHPNILRDSGETYRESLQRRVTSLGLENQICFINNFASEDLLVQYLSACDIYVTPYPNENQISSGTLSFAIGAGAAVISTPYWYAKDLLKDDRGLLFNFKDSIGLGHLVSQLLKNPALLSKYRNNAAQYGKSISWRNIGKLQLKMLRTIIGQKKPYSPLALPIHDMQACVSSLLQPSSSEKLYT